MPIYEYQCDHCGGIEEVLQKTTDTPLSRCNRCEGKLHRIISQSTFHLKGSGWYVTDYAGKSNNTKNANNESTPPAAESGESKTTTATASSKDA